MGNGKNADVRVGDIVRGSTARSKVTTPASTGFYLSRFIMSSLLGCPRDIIYCTSLILWDFVSLIRRFA